MAHVSKDNSITGLNQRNCRTLYFYVNQKMMWTISFVNGVSQVTPPRAI